jgi:iron complex outermembrane receptor protein
MTLTPRHHQLIVILMLTATFDTTPPNRAVAAEPQMSGVAEEMQFLKEETVSIASRHEQPISQAPSNVYVITDEDIRHSGAPDLPTVLRRIPGIEVIQMSGAQFDVSVRGDNQQFTNKMLVLVDGRSIYDDIQGEVYWKAIPVTLPEIKRIEVLKGPASALYGFNAFDGVINIITKSPEEMKGTTLQFGGGEFGTISSAAIQAGTYEKFGYRLSVGRDQTNQWRDRDALAFRSHKFNARTEYNLSTDSRLIVSGGLLDVNRFDGPITGITSASGRFTDGYADVLYERPNFFVRSYWKGFEPSSDFGFNPQLSRFFRSSDLNGNTTANLFANTYNIDSQHSVELLRGNRLTYGVNYRHNSVASNFVDQFGQEDRLGFFLQDEWQVTRSFTVVAGARYDLHTEINPTISPRVALLYSAAQEHTFRLGISVAYRPPTLFETHASLLTVLSIPGFPASTIHATGNHNLDPEKIVSYEAGYQGWFFKHRLRLRADLFINHITDLITFRDTSSTTVTALNDPGQADIYGGEAGVEYLATAWLTGFANYSYQEISQTFTDTSSQRGGPRFKWNAGLRVELDNGFNGEAALHHVGSAVYPVSATFVTFAPFGVVAPDPRVGSYNLLNIRAGYRFWKEKAEVAISAFNALNDRHKEHPLGDTIGSRVMGWVIMRF